ncbi:putative Receptor expression-enhancing protein, partial [Naja naja]
MAHGASRESEEAGGYSQASLPGRGPPPVARMYRSPYLGAAPSGVWKRCLFRRAGWGKGPRGPVEYSSEDSIRTTSLLAGFFFRCSELDDVTQGFALLRLVFGMLYPAYYSYKAVKTKNVKEYVRWMMYWIVFALYTFTETLTDLLISWEGGITRILLYVYKAHLKYVKNYLKILPLKLRFPLYYELKIAFVVWLLSPYTRGASLIYRKFLHPLLSSKEREIDEYIVQAKERGYETMVNFGKQGLNLAATAAVTAAVKGQGAITEKLRSFSMHDLTAIPDDEPIGQRHYQTLPATKKKSKNSIPNEPSIGAIWLTKIQSEETAT